MDPLSKIRRLIASPGGQQVVIGDTDTPPRLLFPGAFNPLHHGHREMARIACDLVGQTVEYEMSITNVDKPQLALDEISVRLRQFSASEIVRLTRSATFAEKAELFPGVTFVVGSDTLWRIWLPKYYGGSESVRDSALQTIIDCQCKLLVFGRLIDRKFRSLSDLNVGPRLLDICQSVPESHFREDVSSIQLRRETQEPD